MAIVTTKLVLFVGVCALLGPGVVIRFVARGAIGARAQVALRRTAIAGGVLVIVGSGVGLLVALVDVLGYVDGQLFRQFLTSSTQGRAALVRCGFVLTLPVVARVGTRAIIDARLGTRAMKHARTGTRAVGETWLGTRAMNDARLGTRAMNYARLGTRAVGNPRSRTRTVGDVAWTIWALGILGTYTAVSHNAGITGWWPLAADLVHLVAAVAWIGGILGITFVPGLRDARSAFGGALGRVSVIGLISVATLFATGVFSATLHIGEPSYIATTPYGWALAAKVAAVLVIVAIAARNRWHHMPRALAGDVTPGFLRSLRWESALLAVVLGITSLLTSLPPPH